MKSQFLPAKPPAILFSIVVFFIHFPSFSCQSDNTEWYSSCSNFFNCGEIRDVDYPFWGGNRPRECGHPGLELRCNNGKPTIKIMNLDYQVLDINPNSQILKITRDDISGDICPQEFVNTTLDSQLFEYTSGYVNLTVQYGCPPLNIPVPNQLTCTIKGVTYQNGYIVPGAQGPGTCRASIFIPIHSSSLGFVGELSTLRQLIEDGFEVRWKVDSSACNECKKSNGTCGYDLKTNKFTCLCPNDQPPGTWACRNMQVDEERSPQPSQSVGSELFQTFPSPPPPPSLENMHQKNLLSTFSLLVIASLTLIHIPKSFCQDLQQYVTCGEPFRCGDKNFSYPFWGENRPSSCGYPGFELTCRDNVPLLTFQSLRYRILVIDDSRQSLTVARDDLWNDLCPRFIYDTAFNYSIFKHSPDLWNVAISYGCNINIPNLPQLNRFDCPGNNSDVSTTNFYAATTFDINPTDAGCNRSISVPIKDGFAIVNSTVLQATLRDGFAIEWEANNSVCDECTQSSGRCGYNTSTTSFICFCSDRPYDLTCGNTGNGGGGSGGVNTPVSIVLAIAGAVIAGVGLGWLIFFCRQRRKRLQAAESSQVVQIESKELPTTPFAKKAALTIPDTFTKSIPTYPSSKSEFGRDSSYFGVQVFSYHELEEATDNFSQSRELGDGGFGIVYYGVLADGRIVAVKRLYENNFKRVEQFINEVEILTRLRHANLVTLYGCTSKRSRELLLVYEYISNGTVADHLHGKRSTSGLLSWPIRLNIAIETADALAYLHASDIIHRDVKTNNILLDNDFHVKVADFGLSRLFPTDVTHVSTAPQGTPGYVDPEYYQCYQLTEKSDVYSFGVVLIELLSSLQAVDTNRHRHDINLANMAINKIQNHTLDELVDASLDFGPNSSVRRMITQVSELAFRCLQQERDMRPSMQEVVNALRKIQNEGLNAQKVEVVDILIDDGGIVKDNVSPPSPDSVNDKWASISTPTSSG